MLWFIIAIIVTICIVANLISERWCWTWGEIIGYGSLAFLMSIICAFMVLVLSSAVAEVEAQKTYHIAEDVDIYALQDNVTTEGSFFLGSGNVDGEFNYFYVEKTELGYTVKDIDADQAYIQYTSDRCHIERQTYTFDNWFVNLIAVPLSDRYIIYIPEGSILNNYSVDLK